MQFDTASQNGKSYYEQMTKEELLSIVSSYLSFLTSFFEEYKDELSFPEGERVTPLLYEIKEGLTSDQIPEVMYPRICDLVNGIGIKTLSDTYHAFHGYHSLDRYEHFIKDIIINCFFASKTFALFKAIDFVNSNVVLIGANGSGKTTFANSIRQELERTNSGIVIPAQKLLVFPTYTSLPTYSSAISVYKQRQTETLDVKQTYTAVQTDDYPYEIVRKYGTEMHLLLSALLGERMAKRNQYCSEIRDGEIVDTAKFKSVLDEVIEIWNDLIGHRELFVDDSGSLQIRFAKDKSYPAYRMSDGEREIFYVVGRVLLANASSLIIVDEPELHLHKAILNKLWDRLEHRRSDCMFIYLTHDIDFASSRTAKKCWIKSYINEIVDEWDLEPIEDNVIPEELLMKILGSRKTVLFCEGKPRSLDRQLFEELFPNMTVTPVDSCKDVIDYTKAFNKIASKYTEAIGIIDTDFRTNEQLEKLATEGVYSYDVAEIENLFLIEDFIIGFAKYKREDCDSSVIKAAVLKLFEKNIPEQVSLYVSQRINYLFKQSHVKCGQTRDEVITNYSDFQSQIQIEKWYEKRERELRQIVADNNYNRAILVYNNKGLHSVIEKALNLGSYNYKALDYLKNSDEAKEVLRRLFPKQVLSKN